MDNFVGNAVQLVDGGGDNGVDIFSLIVLFVEWWRCVVYLLWIEESSKNS